MIFTLIRKFTTHSAQFFLFSNSQTTSTQKNRKSKIRGFYILCRNRSRREMEFVTRTCIDTFIQDCEVDNVIKAENGLHVQDTVHKFDKNERGEALDQLQVKDLTRQAFAESFEAGKF